jgi:TniQ
VRPDDGPLPPPLPVRVRPVAGETTESYIRRLARANHLRPSLLHVYVRNPGLPTGAIPIRRLAAVSGSTVTAIARALTGLPSDRRLQRPPPAGNPQPTRGAQAARKARLFAIIRAEADRGTPIRQIASRHHVHRRMVRQALAMPDAPPPPRKRRTQPAPLIDPIRGILDELADQPRTIWEIWTTMTDEHGSEASYATIRGYVHARRLAKQQQPEAPTSQITAPGRLN